LAEQFEGETKEGIRAGTRESPDLPRGMRGMKFVAGKILWIRGVHPLIDVAVEPRFERMLPQ
jgi:hypothetical protein